ncbi:MAG: hypothetical protein U1F34_00350 [Gammaproteobacteria bacterium]
MDNFLVTLLASNHFDIAHIYWISVNPIWLISKYDFDSKDWTFHVTHGYRVSSGR